MASSQRGRRLHCSGHRVGLLRRTRAFSGRQRHPRRGAGLRHSGRAGNGDQTLLEPQRPARRLDLRPAGRRQSGPHGARGHRLSQGGFPALRRVSVAPTLRRRCGSNRVPALRVSRPETKENAHEAPSNHRRRRPASPRHQDRPRPTALEPVRPRPRRHVAPSRHSRRPPGPPTTAPTGPRHQRPHHPLHYQQEVRHPRRLRPRRLGGGKKRRPPVGGGTTTATHKKSYCLARRGRTDDQGLVVHREEGPRRRQTGLRRLPPFFAAFLTGESHSTRPRLDSPGRG
mmetsp:Transcript_262/g.969  ORF Transcript_262/g.969 Transcript_262/m.969 type:complete len:285 (+) Transcript_262:590-1444(+)